MRKSGSELFLKDVLTKLPGGDVGTFCGFGGGARPDSDGGVDFGFWVGWEIVEVEVCVADVDEGERGPERGDLATGEEGVVGTEAATGCVSGKGVAEGV